jgi:hypothetical protein
MARAAAWRGHAALQPGLLLCTQDNASVHNGPGFFRRPKRNEVFCNVHDGSGADMSSLAIISALLGVWLGLTFRVFILVPATILALATLAGSGAASDAGAMWIVVLDISVIAAMQAGYLGGSALFVAVAD